MFNTLQSSELSAWWLQKVLKNILKFPILTCASFLVLLAFVATSIALFQSASQTSQPISTGPISSIDGKSDNLFIPFVIELNDSTGRKADVHYSTAYTPFRVAKGGSVTSVADVTCYEEIEVSFAFTENDPWWGGTHVITLATHDKVLDYDGEIMCVDKDSRAENEATAKVEDGEIIGVPIETNPFLYPFDTGVLKLIIEGHASDWHQGIPKETYVFTPTVRTSVFTSNWEVAKIWRPSEEFPREANEYTAFNRIWNFGVVFQRPVIYRTLAIVLFLLMFMAILLLLRVREVGSLVEASVGILFGLWGVRQILLPSFVQWLTIVDIGLVYCYILLAAVLLIKSILVPQLSQRKSLRNTKTLTPVPSEENNSGIKDKSANTHQMDGYTGILHSSLSNYFTWTIISTIGIIGLILFFKSQRQNHKNLVSK